MVTKLLDSSFISERRSREVGIRKVLGATRTNVISMISAEYAKLVLIAIMIAIPLGIYSANSWLEEFAYRINVGIVIIVGSGLMAFLVGILTISFHTLKVSATDPVKTIKHE